MIYSPCSKSFKSNSAIEFIKEIVSVLTSTLSFLAVNVTLPVAPAVTLAITLFFFLLINQ